MCTMFKLSESRIVKICLARGFLQTDREPCAIGWPSYTSTVTPETHQYVHVPQKSNQVTIYNHHKLKVQQNRFPESCKHTPFQNFSNKYNASNPCNGKKPEANPRIGHEGPGEKRYNFTPSISALDEGWVVNTMPQPLYPQERCPGQPQGQSGWVQKIFIPTRISSPDHP
jgi:hypothetical protein